MDKKIKKAVEEMKRKIDDASGPDQMTKAEQVDFLEEVSDYVTVCLEAAREELGDATDGS